MSVKHLMRIGRDVWDLVEVVAQVRITHTIITTDIIRFPKTASTTFVTSLVFWLSHKKVVITFFFIKISHRDSQPVPNMSFVFYGHLQTNTSPTQQETWYQHDPILIISMCSVSIVCWCFPAIARMKSLAIVYLMILLNTSASKDFSRTKYWL